MTNTYMITKTDWQTRSAAAEMAVRRQNKNRRSGQPSYFWETQDLPHDITEPELQALINTAMLNLALVSLKQGKPMLLPIRKAVVKIATERLLPADFYSRQAIAKRARSPKRPVDDPLLWQLDHVIYSAAYDVLPDWSNAPKQLGTWHGQSDDNAFTKSILDPMLAHAANDAVSWLQAQHLITTTMTTKQLEPDDKVPNTLDCQNFGRVVIR